MIKAEIITDSISLQNNRLTTFVITYPRIILAEFNTHRMLSRNSASCLHGDTEIFFDLPNAIKKNKKQLFKMKIKDIYEKWTFGAKKRINNYKRGYNRQPIKNRLSNMNIRCLNEDSNVFTNTKILNVIKSGIKDVYEIILEDKYKIKCTKEHRIYTNSGWQTLETMGLSQSKNGIISISNKDVKIAVNGIKIYENIPKEDIVRLKKSGYTNGAIAEIYNVSEDKVKKLCKKYSILGYTGKILKGNKSRVSWNKGKVYKLPEESLILVRKLAKKRIKKDKHLKQKTIQKQRTVFLNEIRNEKLSEFGYKCFFTDEKNKLELHHLDPVWNNKELAFDKNNIFVVSKKFHKWIHQNNLEIELLRWIKEGKNPKNFITEYNNVKVKYSIINKPVHCGKVLSANFVKIKEIKYIGKEDTYDIEVVGPYHNFVANGIVVHNSRAIPVEKTIKQVLENPFVPYYWGKNQKGMQANLELTKIEQELCRQKWLEARDVAVEKAKELISLGLHKQIANRILEPWCWVTTIVTATDWENFFALRAHKDAQPEFRILAELMLEVYNKSNPVILQQGEWHTPFADKYIDSLSLEERLKVATARCARVSYVSFEGDIDHEKDYALHDNLLASGHMSPFEHCATPMYGFNKFSVSNFNGWWQYRKTFSSCGENKKDPRVIKKESYIPAFTGSNTSEN